MVRARLSLVVVLVVLGTGSDAFASGWSIQHVLRPQPVAGRSYLNGVSCPSSRICIAVGAYENDRLGTRSVLAERWNGTRWSLLPAAMPRKATNGELVSVSCPSRRFCMAVGSFFVKGTWVGMAERWNGVKWAIQRMPAPDGPVSPYGVSCTSARACTAVGTPNGYGPGAAERWDGTRWSPQYVDPSVELLGVSCPSSRACTAVGATETSSTAERWDGTSWTTEPSPAPNNDLSEYLAVSCPALGTCTAVGLYKEPRAHWKPLAGAWNGESWSVQPTPDPPGPRTSRLSSVSCVSASACIAVGFYAFNAPGARRTLAERWNGTRWSIQRSPTPPGAKRSSLSSVSCPSSRTCIAVGYSLSAWRRPKTEAGLAMRWSPAQSRQ
jgi:hypothetical protein